MKFGEPTMDNISESLPQENGDDNKESNEVDEFEGLENGVDEAIKKNKEGEALSEEYENEKLTEWESKPIEKKREVIEEKKAYFEENLEKELKEDAENIDELEVPEDIMQEMNKLQEYKEKLRDVNKNLIEERENVLSGIDEQLNGNIDISELSSMEQGEFKDILSGVKNVTQNTLDIEKIDYYLTKDYFSTEGGKERGLLETHEDREIAMEKLEYILKQIGEFEKCLEEISNVEAAKEEVQKMVDKLAEIAEKEPGLFEKLKEAGIVAGIIMLALGVGATGISKLIGIAGPLAAKITTKKIAIGTIGTIGTIGIATNAGTIAGALVGGGILLKMMSWLSKEENRDSLVEGICGAKIPGIAYLFGGRPGSEKK